MSDTAAKEPQPMHAWWSDKQAERGGYAYYYDLTGVVKHCTHVSERADSAPGWDDAVYIGLVDGARYIRTFTGKYQEAEFQIWSRRW